MSSLLRFLVMLGSVCRPGAITLHRRRDEAPHCHQLPRSLQSQPPRVSVFLSYFCWTLFSCLTLLFSILFVHLLVFDFSLSALLLRPTWQNVVDNLNVLLIAQESRGSRLQPKRMRMRPFFWERVFKFYMVAQVRVRDVQVVLVPT